MENINLLIKKIAHPNLIYRNEDHLDASETKLDYFPMGEPKEQDIGTSENHLTRLDSFKMIKSCVFSILERIKYHIKTELQKKFNIHSNNLSIKTIPVNFSIPMNHQVPASRGEQ